MIYAKPGTDGAVVSFKPRYENFIGGDWVAPVKGQYFENITPVTGEVICEVPRSSAEDVELALDAATPRKHWRHAFMDPVEDALAQLPARGVLVQRLSSDAPSESWLAPERRAA